MIGVDNYVRVVMPMFFPSPWSLVQVPPLPLFISQAATQRLASGAEAGATVLHQDLLSSILQIHHHSHPISIFFT